MTTVKYELFFRTFTEDGKIETESITGERFKTLEKAKEKLVILNRGLRYKGYTDRKYVLAKVIKEYIEE